MCSVQTVLHRKDSGWKILFAEINIMYRFVCLQVLQMLAAVDELNVKIITETDHHLSQTKAVTV